ncbi:ABC transporter ATP-binding protein [Guyparkeria halophila]|uniref:ABC transporter ATP-binding protein n=1 Tax=Guyparkeria halophila TaxID=47960 RepID=A0ABZ0YZH8_9GAMM|nr:ABC transporter ATP-binding protein [Guyparkeria halophila]WQH16682.1 ABC transporter ATP-binding protein [Guyparkeria halophila]
MSGSLDVRGLTAGYRRRRILDRLDLPTFRNGDLVAVVGANAAGKSTFMRAVSGLLPMQGEVRLDGEDLGSLPPAERLRRVGYLPQTLPQASSLVAYESLMAALRTADPSMPRDRIEHRVERVFDDLGLRALAFRPLGELSGGQRQMLGLAQVLARQPRLLLLDEPTSALDLRWQIQVLERVRHTTDAGGIALVAIHDLNLALRFCDRLVVLKDGALLAAGDPLEVLDAELLARAYGIEGRVERCSHGYPIVQADRIARPSETLSTHEANTR